MFRTYSLVPSYIVNSDLLNESIKQIAHSYLILFVSLRGCRSSVSLVTLKTQIHTETSHVRYVSLRIFLFLVSNVSRLHSVYFYSSDSQSLLVLRLLWRYRLLSHLLGSLMTLWLSFCAVCWWLFVVHFYLRHRICSHLVRLAFSINDIRIFCISVFSLFAIKMDAQWSSVEFYKLIAQKFDSPSLADYQVTTRSIEQLSSWVLLVVLVFVLWHIVTWHLVTSTVLVSTYAALALSQNCYQCVN